MKTFILTVIAVGLTNTAFSQKAFILSLQEKRAFFAVSAGASLPVGSFSKTTNVDESAGMANQGIALNLAMGCRLAGPFGVMVRAEHHRNGLNTAAMIHELPLNYTDQWTASAGSWSMTTLMGGPYIQLPMGRFSVDARLLVGRAQATRPDRSIQGNAENAYMTHQTTGSASTALAVGGGLAVRYRLGPSISLQASGDYSQAQFLFDGLMSTTWRNTNRSASQLYSTKQEIGVVSASVGVAVLFGNSNRPF